MKFLVLAVALLASVNPALAQGNVSISIGQPGFYGRIDIGDYAPPPVVYTARPVIVQRHPRYAAQEVYLRVPPGHRKNWSRHCGRYGACGQRVLFVRDEWYTDSYAPRYREHYRDRDHHRDGGRHEYRDERHGGKHGHGRDRDRDHGRDHRKGDGHGRRD
jgi:hypothetical protein